VKGSSRGYAYVECRLRTMPDAAGMAVVASTHDVTFVVSDVESDGDASWRSLVLAREGHPRDRIVFEPVSDQPLVVRIHVDTDAPCGPVAFHLAMETHGRTLERWPPAA
jgi:hypothetical protein